MNHELKSGDNVIALRHIAGTPVSRGDKGIIKQVYTWNERTSNNRPTYAYEVMFDVDNFALVVGDTSTLVKCFEADIKGINSPKSDIIDKLEELTIDSSKDDLIRILKNKCSGEEISAVNKALLKMSSN